MADNKTDIETKKLIIVALRKKHQSSYVNGISKQLKRHRNKPKISKVPLKPTILTYSSKHDTYVVLKVKYLNSDATKLNDLYNRNTCDKGLIKSKFPYKYINENGKYALTYAGQQLLARKKT